MGFFQFLEKVMQHSDELKSLAQEAAEKLDAAAGNSAGSVHADKTSAKPVPVSTHRTPKDILDSADIPSKPSLLREDFFFDNDAEFRTQFMLPGDFVEFESHAEPEACHQYEPFSDEDFTEYDGNLPFFMITCEDGVHSAVEKFKKNGTVGTDCKRIDGGKMLFRAKLPLHDRVMTCYGFDRGISQENYGMCMVYNRDVEGTPLEAKLLAALDEAAASYKEIQSEE